MTATKRKFAKKECTDTGKPFKRSFLWRKRISDSKIQYYKEHPNELPKGKKNPMYGIHRFGKNNPNFGKRWSKQKRKEFSIKQKKNSPWIGKKHKISTRIKMSKAAKKITKTESWKKRMRISALKRAKRQGNISFNPFACKFFDTLNKKNGWKLKHAHNGGEVECIGYSLDAYDKKRNIVVEYDESHHYTLRGSLKRKDIQRQNRIIKELRCKFYRFNEREKKLYKIV